MSCADGKQVHISRQIYCPGEGDQVECPRHLHFEKSQHQNNEHLLLFNR